MTQAREGFPTAPQRILSFLRLVAELRAKEGGIPSVYRHDGTLGGKPARRDLVTPDQARSARSSQASAIASSRPLSEVELVRLAPVDLGANARIEPLARTLDSGRSAATRVGGTRFRAGTLLWCRRTELSPPARMCAPAAGEGRKSRRYSNKYRGEEAQMHGKQSCHTSRAWLDAPHRTRQVRTDLNGRAARFVTELV
jgi:hypothetical protein